jgi:hypothetical protein
MDISNLIIKKMESEDQDDFIDIYNKSTKIMYLPKNEVHSLEIILRLYNADNCVTFGAYHNEKLVGTLTGRYFDEVSYWYGFNLFTDIKENFNTLALHGYSMIISLELFDKLIEVGEKKGKYSFYTNKNLKHQLGIEKSINRLKKNQERLNIKNYRMFDYIPLYEQINPVGYDAGKSGILRNHRLLYPSGIKYNAETIIVWHTLNLHERKKILGLPLD